MGCLFARQVYFQIVCLADFSVAFPLLIGLAWIDVEYGIVLCMVLSCFVAFHLSLLLDFCLVEFPMPDFGTLVTHRSP